MKQELTVDLILDMSVRRCHVVLSQHATVGHSPTPPVDVSSHVSNDAVVILSNDWLLGTTPARDSALREVYMESTSTLPPSCVTWRATGRFGKVKVELSSVAALGLPNLFF